MSYLTFCLSLLVFSVRAQVWSPLFSSTGISTDYPSALQLQRAPGNPAPYPTQPPMTLLTGAIDASMEIGQYQLTSGNEIDTFVVPILDTGSLVYVHEHANSQGLYDEGHPTMLPGPATVDKDGNVYTSATWNAVSITIAGVTYNNAGRGYNILIQKLSPTGVVLWTLTMGSTNNDDHMIGLKWEEGINSLIAYGDFSGTFYSNSANLNGHNVISNGGYDLFVVYLSGVDGSTTQLNNYGGTNDETASAFGFNDFDDSVLLAGQSTSGPWSVNGFSVSCTIDSGNNCIFWLKINATTTTGQIETQCQENVAFLAIAVNPQVPTTVIAGGVCRDWDCYGSIGGTSVSTTSFIVFYDTTNNNVATSVLGFGQNNAPMISMAVACNHIFVTGNFYSSSSGVNFGGDFLSAGGSAWGNYIIKIQTNTNGLTWMTRVNVNDATCFIASDYSGRDYSLACVSPYAMNGITFGESGDPFPNYSLSSGGVFVWNGTDDDPFNCPLPSPPYLGCTCNLGPLFQELRTTYPTGLGLLDPFNV